MASSQGYVLSDSTDGLALKLSGAALLSSANYEIMLCSKTNAFPAVCGGAEAR
jgi:hypothetical protein